MKCLVQYQWKTDAEMPHWALPDESKSAIDLRRLDQILDPQAVGYAIADYDVLPDGAIPLDTGNVTRDRDAWLSTLGFRPEGDNAVDQAWSMLLNGADDTHADACRPLRCGRADKFELWLGGKRERFTSHIDRLKQGVYVRRDLDRIFDDVTAGKLPAGIHRKSLKAEADRLGIDWQTLRSKSARWRGETALDPATIISDPFNSGADIALDLYNGWTCPQGNSAFSTGSGALTINAKHTGSATHFAWSGTSLSSSNNQTDFIDTTRLDDNSYNMHFGPACRGDGASTGYVCSHYVSSFRLFNSVGASLTLLSSVSRVGTEPYRLRVNAIGSTIKAAQSAASWDISVTDTAVTAGLLVGAIVLRITTSLNRRLIVQEFYAKDFGQPASISTSPASGSTAGGTAITITGTGFESNATVAVKGSAATGVTVASETSITATTPAGTVGAGNVVVTNPDTGFSGTQTNGFTYTEPTTTTTTTTTTSTTTTTTTTTATPSTTTTLCYQGETRFGLYSYKPGCGSINPRNSHFKRGSQS